MVTYGRCSASLYSVCKKFHRTKNKGLHHIFQQGKNLASSFELDVRWGSDYMFHIEHCKSQGLDHANILCILVWWPTLTYIRWTEIGKWSCYRKNWTLSVVNLCPLRIFHTCDATPVLFFLLFFSFVIPNLLSATIFWIFWKFHRTRTNDSSKNKLKS